MGIETFGVRFVYECKAYTFYGEKIERHLSDGCENSLLSVKAFCHEDDLWCVVTLTPDWKINSIIR